MSTPEYRFFHHLSWTIGVTPMFHDSSISERTMHRIPPVWSAKTADLVQRYVDLCNESWALSDQHKALNNG
jgi:hypothetical protein